MKYLNSSKCPNCGNVLNFSPDFGTLYCEYCDSNFNIDHESQLNTKHNYNNFVKFDETFINQFHCNSCGSNLSSIKDAKVKRCPNCGSNDLAITNNISFVPDGVVPFKISKKRATENFYNWIKKRKFAPNDLKKLAKLGKLSGLYTPVWNFDCSTFTTYRGVGIDEDRDRNGNVHTHRHPFSGKFNSEYKDVLMTANKRISNVTLNQLGNFGLNELKVYNPQYLCGFIGSDIDFDIHSSYKNFVSFVENKDSFKAKSGHFYDRIESFSSNTEILNPKFNYIYLPIWANYYTYKNKNYSCYINGYSGIVKGKAPKSFWKVFLFSLGIGIAVGVVFLLAYFISRI